MAVVLISGCIGQDPYTRNVGGVDLHFRANLNEAANVSVYPNEAALRSVLLNTGVESIGVAYIPNDTENAFYLADSYELAYKITIINKYFFNRTKLVDSIPVNSSLDAFSQASPQRPVIMLFGPSQTNATRIVVSGSFVSIQGASLDEVNRTYTDLDLATDKLLLVLIGNVSS